MSAAATRAVAIKKKGKKRWRRARDADVDASERPLDRPSAC
jgi:hypothetical protein